MKDNFKTIPTFSFKPSIKEVNENKTSLLKDDDVIYDTSSNYNPEEVSEKTRIFLHVLYATQEKAVELIKNCYNNNGCMYLPQ